MLIKLLQDVIYQMKDAADGMIGIIDENGIIISCNQLMKIGESLPNSLNASVDFYISEGFTYRTIHSEQNCRYYMFVEGEDKTAENLSMLVAVSLNNISKLYNENYDKNTFIKNIILDNIPSGNIYIKAKDFCVKTDAMRSLFLIHTENNSAIMLLNMLKKIFNENSKDYIFTINEQDIVLVYETKQKDYETEIKDTVKKITDTIASVYDTNIFIGISRTFYELNDLAYSFQEAQLAIKVGRVFDIENNVVYYEKLGIGRLIYQLPATLCEVFLDEILKSNTLNSLEPETIHTILCFFENNLNVSETSRKLSIHRNTLVYRLEKVRRMTGLDLNNFEQAITFKIVLMVKKYLNTLHV